MTGTPSTRTLRTITYFTWRLCRLRYTGSAQQWGFAIYRDDDYEDSYQPAGSPPATPGTLDTVQPLPQRPTACT